jgi:CelD/BcsL family acetyltransferase involved in cellulose biosynthesis
VQRRLLQGGNIVRVEVIETKPAFNRLEQDWNAVYAADPDAQLFLSWRWLSGWLGQISSPWLILAAKADNAAEAPYVAFLPLRLGVKAQKSHLHNELNMAGNFAADYTGILCAPEIEHQAIPAFARYLKQMNWARLNLENVRVSESRLRLLLAHFPKSGFQTSEISRVGKVDGIDNNLCPFAPLPPDWNAYLDTLSANTRQKIRRLLKLVDQPGEYRISHATTETVERDLDALLQFWQTKWRPRKGDLVHSLVRSNRAMLKRSFAADLLFLPTLWQEDRPLAALATFTDPQKRSFLFYMTGRDETFEGPSPGLILHAHSIRYAIENGFTEYDFLRGNEAYKYSFGVKERRIRCVAIDTRNGLNLGGRLDLRTIPDALKEATELHQTGKLPEAENGYRQVLAVEPDSADAVHRLGQLLAAKGDHAGAKRMFTRLTAIRPDTHKSWLGLARSCEALGHDLEAANAYREVIKLRPDISDVFGDIGKILVRLGLTEEFDTALATILARSAAPVGRNAGNSAASHGRRAARQNDSVSV